MNPTILEPNRWVTRDVYAATLGVRQYADGEYPGAITHYWTVHRGRRIPLLLDGTRYVPVVDNRAILMFIALLEIAISERRSHSFHGENPTFHHKKGVYVWKHERELDPISPASWEAVLHGPDEEAEPLLESVMEEIALLRRAILTNH